MRYFKNIVYISILIVLISGCSNKNHNLDDKVGKSHIEYKSGDNVYFYIERGAKKVFFQLHQDTSSIILDISDYKDNIEYVKLIDDKSGLNIDKLLPKISDIKSPNTQDGFVDDNSNDRLKVKIFVPSVYLNKGTFFPKLQIAYTKSNGDLITLHKEEILLYLSYQVYGVENKGEKEYPIYKTINDTHDGKSLNSKIRERITKQSMRLNKNRIDRKFIKELESKPHEELYR